MSKAKRTLVCGMIASFIAVIGVVIYCNYMRKQNSSDYHSAKIVFDKFESWLNDPTIISNNEINILATFSKQSPDAVIKQIAHYSKNYKNNSKILNLLSYSSIDMHNVDTINFDRNKELLFHLGASDLYPIIVILTDTNDSTLINSRFGYLVAIKDYENNVWIISIGAYPKE